MIFFSEDNFKFAFSKEIASLKQVKATSDVKFGILGVPFDSTTTYLSGARSGPLMVREASYNFEKYHLTLQKELSTIFFDFGDVQIIPGNFQKTCDQIQFSVQELKELELFPLLIGGDHSISYAACNALDLKEVTVIHFDAHPDLRDSYAGEKFSHATVMRRIYDLSPKKIVQLGLRSSSEEETLFAKSKAIKQFKSINIHDNIDEILDYLQKINGPIYVSIDIDVLDPAFAPSVGTPSPGGLNPIQMEKLILSLQGKEIIGIDLVEVSSSQVGDITSINAAKILLDLLFLFSD